VPITETRGIAGRPPHRKFLAVYLASKTRDPIPDHVINHGIDRDAGILNIRDRLELEEPAVLPDNPTVVSGTRGTLALRDCRHAPSENFTGNYR